MANFVYPAGKLAQLGLAANQGPVDWDTDTIKLMLVNQTYRDLADGTKAGHDYRNDVTANEISGTGYTAGGATLAGASITQSSNSARIDYSPDPAWPNSTIANAWGGVVYKSTGNAATDVLLLFVDFGEAVSSTNATFTAILAAAGLYELT